MIFITVGTTIWFDDLIKTIDQLVASGQIHEPVVCQIGNGKYIPKNCECFRFQKSIDEWIQRSSVVINGHCPFVDSHAKAFCGCGQSHGSG